MSQSSIDLLIATRNAGKLIEFRRLFQHIPLNLVSLQEANLDLTVEESGETFEENARLKAVTYAEATGRLTLADDSGLEVDALGGRPGVLSARYGGPGLSDGERVQRLLDELRDVPGWKRRARFRAVLALAGPGVPGGVITVEGVVEGAIAHQPIGSNGFGYDPVFWIPSLAKTSAELSGEQKDSISHRGQAAKKMAGILAELAGQR